MSTEAAMRDGLTIEWCEAEQGSYEWLADRAGVISASNFSEVMKTVGGLTDQQQKYVDALLAGKSQADALAAAGYKSKPRAEKIDQALDGALVTDFTEAAKDLAFVLASERIGGMPLDEDRFETWAMKRGHELEKRARAVHSLEIGQQVQEVGFVRTTDRKFGASADGLISDRAGAEYKAFTQGKKLRSIILESDIADYLPQCQGGMWLTGYTEWHFGLYCPSLEPAGRDLTLFVVKRDDDYIEEMEQTLIRFDALVEQYKLGLMQKEQVRTWPPQ